MYFSHLLYHTCNCMSILLYNSFMFRHSSADKTKGVSQSFKQWFREYLCRGFFVLISLMSTEKHIGGSKGYVHFILFFFLESYV